MRESLLAFVLLHFKPRTFDLELAFPADRLGGRLNERTGTQSLQWLQCSQCMKAWLPSQCAQAIVQRISTVGNSTNSPGRSQFGIGTVMVSIVRKPSEA